MDTTFRIYSLNESTLQGEPMFWGNEDGWGSIESSTLFTLDDKNNFDLPMPNDSTWISDSDAKKMVGAYRASFLFKE